MMHAPLTRRGLLAAGGDLGLGGLLAACGDGDSSADGSSGSGAFTFTDDRGQTVSLDAVPTSIVAFVGTAAALHDYGVECTGVFGPTTKADGSPDVQAGELDVTKVTVVGNTWGEFNIEKYATLGPQVLIAPMYVQDTLWYVPDDSAEQILALAPSIGLMLADKNLPEPLERHAKLAEALGADMSSAKVTDAKARYDAAVETLRAAAAAKPGVKVMACSGDVDLFYASVPAKSADLTFFAELGVEFVVPDNPDEQGFFESLSWENADKYAADLLMLDNRSTQLQTDVLAEKPTWAQLPAVKAGQITPWVTEPRFSYAGCAPNLEALAAAINDAEIVTE